MRRLLPHHYNDAFDVSDPSRFWLFPTTTVLMTQVLSAQTLPLMLTDQSSVSTVVVLVRTHRS